MADAVHKEGGSPSGFEITTDARKLPDIGTTALGIEDSHSLPPSDLGWEGGQVLAAPVAFKASLYTDNPIHSNMAVSPYAKLWPGLVLEDPLRDIVQMAQFSDGRLVVFVMLTIVSGAWSL
jgi:hypothetical protein